VQTQVTLVINTMFNMELLSPEGSGKVSSGDEKLQIVSKGLQVA
jgi:hypothetical protein